MKVKKSLKTCLKGVVHPPLLKTITSKQLLKIVVWILTSLMVLCMTLDNARLELKDLKLQQNRRRVVVEIKMLAKVAENPTFIKRISTGDERL